MTENSVTKKNYRFYGIDEKKEALIDKCFDGYSVTYFCEIHNMADYIRNEKAD